MKTQPDPDQVDFYRENGFVVLDEFLGDDELDKWRMVLDDAIEARGDLSIPALGVHDVKDSDEVPEEVREQLRYQQKIFKQRVNLWQTHAGARELLLDEGLGKLVAELAGVEGVRMWHDQALIKPPYGNPTAFHLDVPIWSFTSPHAISIWVPLDDATIENGCLWYVPGSHKAEKYDNVPIANELGALFDVYPEWRDVAPVPAPVRAGGAVVHNGLVFHGAGANMTPRPRRAMTCGFMPDGATFNGQPNILPPELLSRLRVGDPLDDDSQNPLLFSKAQARVGAR